MDRLSRCRVYDIAHELGITTGGTSKLVDRIEARGYCRRLPNPDDLACVTSTFGSRRRC
jgi:DNA-binding MarR family transcriptional regulator